MANCRHICIPRIHSCHTDRGNKWLYMAVFSVILGSLGSSARNVGKSKAVSLLKRKTKQLVSSTKQSTRQVKKSNFCLTACKTCPLNRVMSPPASGVQRKGHQPLSVSITSSPQLCLLKQPIDDSILFPSTMSGRKENCNIAILQQLVLMGECLP